MAAKKKTRRDSTSTVAAPAAAAVAAPVAAAPVVVAPVVAAPVVAAPVVAAPVVAAPVVAASVVAAPELEMLLTERIRARARALWEARGGTSFDNWIAAEVSVKNELSASL